PIETMCGRLMSPSLKRVINATGIVIHTNLGRAPIAPDVFERARDVAARYTNLEYDLASGKRGSRHTHAESLLTRLTGAESAVVVNNCAAALLTSLHAHAHGREVIVSRGELVEIGGSFRLPDIMKASGAKLVEVGTTNRTRARDYREAITDRTAAILKVHQSNFRMEGFTEEVAIDELSAITREACLALLYDLGSGSFLRAGKGAEPTVAAEMKRGADVVMMSGDKLLGSVQAGIMLGTKPAIDTIKKSALMRAVRPDKVTLSLLESTLLYYLEPARALAEIPVLGLIERPLRAIKEDAEAIRDALRERLPENAVAMEIVEGKSEAGGGAIGQPAMDTALLALAFPDRSPDEIAAALRSRPVPVVARIYRDRLWIDPRTLFADDHDPLVTALAEVIEGQGENT
ncbi:MAG: L-seryl-tRNA(Sec) selenium transferase, partial [Gemmatimonadetes bacterium]|nr:L-seryl-tRNA(Sec) selenium transferase [Gemmatimonadota bacterium]